MFKVILICILSQAKSARLNSFAASLIISVLIAAAAGFDTGASAQATKKTSAKSVPVSGPGVLYIARKNKNIGFWVLNDLSARPAGEVSPDGLPATVGVNLSKGITAVFYADDLPFGNSFKMQFTGALENEKCPECRIIMPRPPKPWAEWLAGIKEETSVKSNENLPKLLEQQSRIFSAAKAVREEFLQQQKEFVSVSETNVKELLDQIGSVSTDGETKLNGALQSALAFEKQLNPQVAADAATAQKTADTYEKYLSEQTPKMNAAINCSNADNFFCMSKGFETQLALAYPDPVADNFEEEPGAPNREVAISQFETLASVLQDQIEPCIIRFLGDDLLADTDDFNFNGGTPNLSQGNLIAPASYETLGSQISANADGIETDVAAWQLEMEQRAAKLDSLNYWIRSRQRFETLPGPLFKFAGSQWPEDGLPVNYGTVLSGNYALQAGNTIEPVLPTGTVRPASTPASSNKMPPNAAQSKPIGIFQQGSLASAALSPNPCGNNTFFLTINLIGASIIIGTPFNDSITADNDTNIIFGLAGNDCIDAKDGFDAVFGMGGSDTIYGGGDHDFLFGGGQADTIYGGKGKSYNATIAGINFTFDIGNFISGDGGNDIISGSGANGLLDKLGFTDVILGDGFAGANSGIDTIDGDAGIDFIFGQAKDDVLGNTGYGAIKVNGIPIILGSAFFGNDGDDTINGTNTPVLGDSLGDFIFGQDGSDRINAGKGTDFVFGGSGGDFLNGNDGADFLFGEDGSDVIHGNDGPEIIAGNNGTDMIYSDAGVGALLLGNAELDYIYGGNGTDIALGGLDSDLIDGGDGIVDILSGGPGLDYIKGQNGTDLIFGDKGNDFIQGGNGVDLIFGGDNTDNISGEGGTDIIFGNANDPPVKFSSNTNYTIPCTKGMLEKLNGNDGVDIIFGNAGCDELNGGDGVDLMRGDNDDDELNGGGGVDFMWGSAGNDKINGEGGIDVGFGNSGMDELDGGDGTDLLLGGEGNDTLRGEKGYDFLIGNRDDDKLFGGDGIDFLFGGKGNDDLKGENMSDLLFGGSENDTADGGDALDLIFGSGGDDTLSGGPATDVIFGGAGADNIYGNAGSDILFGGDDGEQMMDGQGDNNLIFGNGGPDTITSMGGNNNLILGNAGDDTITAWQGRNLIFGNDDNDNLDGAGPCAAESPREFLFGNGGSNTLRGNKKNNRDLLFGGTKNRC